MNAKKGRLEIPYTEKWFQNEHAEMVMSALVPASIKTSCKRAKIWCKDRMEVFDL